jgi:hypothetical protein
MACLVVRNTACIRNEIEKCIGLRVPRQYPLVLLVKVAGDNLGHWEMVC